MFNDRDRYTAWYTAHLWMLLPEIYRASNSDDPATKGPLRELVERLGAQAAILRRSIDRSLEDQSIESCDDWLIPYLGDLLATNLVAGLDARAQRLDVAKTIYYRRRKGTVSLLEELAVDVTNWNARAVEFFRRLGRHRHSFDPVVGNDSGDDLDSAIIDGLRGALSRTPAGGFANLRHAGAAQLTSTAFDEYFHTADFRRSRNASGWYNIPKLGFFLWRLKSYACDDTTPVQDVLCAGQFTFDPTGREVPLFSRDFRGRQQYGDSWVTPDQWMLPGPISSELFGRDQAHLYPDSLAVVDVTSAGETIQIAGPLRIAPERGRFHPPAPPAPGVRRRVRYHQGLSSEIGAGPYDRRASGDTPLPQPAPIAAPVSGGGGALQTALAALGATGTLPIADSLTSTGAFNLAGFTNLLIQAAAEQRPVVRLDGASWILEGALDAAGTGASLAIDGLLVSGGDLILRGHFNTVTIHCTTLDPGQEFNNDGSLPQSVDGRELLPTTLWIEGSVARLVLNRSIAGPIRTRLGGAVESISLTDCILQGPRTTPWIPIDPAAILDSGRLLRLLQSSADPLAVYLRGSFTAAAAAALAGYDPAHAPAAALVAEIAGELDSVLAAGPLYSAARFAGIPLSSSLAAEAAAGPAPADLPRVNRLLLEAAYPLELAPAALACGSSAVAFERCTVLGAVYAHRISASETILWGFAAAEDNQDGCVRFSAFVDGSSLASAFESVTLPSESAIFVTRRFAQPAYCQLAALADRELLSAGSIVTGARNGSQMGAFSRELYAIKERGLRAKLDEYMPIGVTPVLIYVT